jgi:hypothetical protein
MFCYEELRVTQNVAVRLLEFRIELAVRPANLTDVLVVLLSTSRRILDNTF